MRFIHRNILFIGNIDRLKRFIKRENGKLLDHQKFIVVFRSRKIRRQYRAIPFCFHCAYEKQEDGYNITFYALPSTAGCIYILIGWAFLFFLTWWKHLNPLNLLLFFIFALLNYLREYSDCVKQFKAACQK